MVLRVEPGMVIHHHQSDGGVFGFSYEVTDEIGLPHVVRSFFFETYKG